MAVDAKQPPAAFDPAAFASFRFVARELDGDGHVTLRYALDDGSAFVERSTLPVAAPARRRRGAPVDGLLSLLHWVAGVSYFKTALPPRDRCETGAPGPPPRRCSRRSTPRASASSPTTNGLAALPRPRFPRAAARGRRAAARRRPRDSAARVLVPVGGGKDSAVAIEIVRRSGGELALFSVGDAPPIARTAASPGCRACSPRASSTRCCSRSTRRRDQRPRPGHGDRLLRGAADGRAARLRRGRDGQRALGFERQRPLGRGRGQPPVQQGPRARSGC